MLSYGQYEKKQRPILTNLNDVHLAWKKSLPSLIPVEKHEARSFNSCLMIALSENPGEKLRNVLFYTQKSMYRQTVICIISGIKKMMHPFFLLTLQVRWNLCGAFHSERSRMTTSAPSSISVNQMFSPEITQSVNLQYKPLTGILAFIKCHLETCLLD